MAELSLPNILNDCIDRLAMGQSVAECLRAYPAQANTLRPMLDSGLAATQADFPAAEVALAQERIWARMDAAFNTPIPSPRPLRFPRSWQWAIAAAAALLMLAGVLYAAQNSQPGEPLYGVKVFINSILPGDETTPVPTETPLPTATSTATPVPTETPSPTTTEHATAAIEGPVEAINGNTITIYGIEIVIAGDDPLLDVIQVGDVIRVEGNFSGGSVTIDVSDIIIVGAEDEVFTNDTGEVWRDDGTCNNPPPDWAVANGWRRRCEGGNVSPGSRGNGNANGNASGQGMGRGN